MQNTPPVATGGFWWSVGAQFRGWLGAERMHTFSVAVREFVKRWERRDPPVWTVEELQAIHDAELPLPAEVGERARELLALGLPFPRVAELLEVEQDQLIHCAPAVDTRVLWVPPTVTTRVQRLKEESW